jgi:hypothetical protein
MTVMRLNKGVGKGLERVEGSDLKGESKGEGEEVVEEKVGFRKRKE